MGNWFLDNRERIRAGERERYRADPSQAKNRQLKHKYGITMDDYEALLAEQDCKCGVCGVDLSTVKRSCIDHSHTTGKVRGVLCGHCNLGIGHLRDDPERLRAAIEYLERA